MNNDMIEKNGLENKYIFWDIDGYNCNEMRYK